MTVHFFCCLPEENMSRVKDKKKKSRSLAENTSNTAKTHKVDRPNVKDELGELEENHASRKLRNKKRKNNQTAERETVKRDESFHGTEDGLVIKNGRSNELQENKERKPNKKKSKKEKKAQLEKVDSEAEDNSRQQNDDKKIETTPPRTQCEIENSEELSKTDYGRSSKTRKSRKVQKKSSISSNGEENLLQKRDVEEDQIYQISSGDGDYSKGMKKWVMEYHQRRPGLKVLQERIDEFITAHEAREEKERTEREALAAEDGWTVVTHHKGRKKTTDAETGVAVGSVAQAAVLDKMAKKKSKGGGLDFYRFQKREARKNEIMELQEKFEQDRKKIQQLRAARKFRPY